MDVNRDDQSMTFELLKAHSKFIPKPVCYPMIRRNRDLLVWELLDKSNPLLYKQVKNG